MIKTACTSLAEKLELVEELADFWGCCLRPSLLIVALVLLVLTPLLLLLIGLRLGLLERLLMLDLLLLSLLVNLCKRLLMLLACWVCVHLLIGPLLSLGNSVLKPMETLVVLVLLPDLPFIDLGAANILPTHD